ncbi:hypothetical protein SAMN04488102_10453 [Alkalibacterium subtropicum]|uniref:ASCH domain-containing protein n=1 Tax=Alkalibacterium subtropicum TaxID=753702 RepID=A0A1I1HFT4_9LACT|nr:hypothetical protein [Alkalibacterium subtropicum]SFC22877.1 hypothetical protein SAMN04488102_10453 [Alkalibacterium subtropicum]
MDHIVYVDAKAKELDKLINSEKTAIIRGAAGRKLPYGKVDIGDMLYFINNNGEGKIKAKAAVTHVLNTEKLTKSESEQLVQANQDKLHLTEKQFSRWAGKRYLVLIEVDQVVEVEPFKINREDYGNMDDWLPVGSIDKVKNS